jgi:hypothetical protein
MQYALLIYEDEAVSGKESANPAYKALVERHMAFSGELRASGVQTGGAGLKNVSSATSVRLNKGGYSVHDGPLAETREQLGGFYLVNAADLDEAIALAKRVPLTDGGCIEVRPLLGMG